MLGKEKFGINLSSVYRLLHPMHTVPVSYVSKTGRPNIISLAWAMPASINPHSVAVSIAPRRHSHSLIEETKELVVNIPTMNLVNETLFCGRVSGREHTNLKKHD